MSRIDIIAVEEHVWTPAIRDRVLAMSPPGERLPPPLADALVEVGEPRLAAMDAMGVDMQILSLHTPGVQTMEVAEAAALARDANELLASAVSAHPERLLCFAALPTPDPGAAVDELERAVSELGHCGAMLYGRTGEKFLDHPDFAPIFDRAGQLGVPLYIHPQRPVEAVSDIYYTQGLPPIAGRVLANFAWGWHVETAVNVIRLIISGAFERSPAPQVILGHWGELIPFFLERLDEVFALFNPGISKGFAETFQEHFYVTPAGMWSYPMLQHAIAELGTDRILYSIDYPLIRPTDGAARRFLEDAPISIADKHKIGHLNAERLFNLSNRDGATDRVSVSDPPLGDS